MQIKPVRIIITTNTSELDSEMMDEILGMTEAEFTEEAEKDAAQSFMFETDGVMTSDSGELRVTYTENAPGGSEKFTVITFLESCPTTVSMIGGGAGPIALVFDSVKRRCRCVHNLGPFPVEMTVRTDSLSNSLNYKTGGKLYAEYTVELCGVAVEFNRVTIKVEPMDVSEGEFYERCKKLGEYGKI